MPHVHHRPQPCWLNRAAPVPVVPLRPGAAVAVSQNYLGRETLLQALPSKSAQATPTGAS